MLSLSVCILTICIDLEMAPVSPEKEPDRVAPVELTFSVPPGTTLAVAYGVGELQLEGV